VRFLYITGLGAPSPHKGDVYDRSKMSQREDRDSRRFQDRRNLSITNANMYISNNNNPFLVSPYSFPTGNLAKKSDVTDISDIISTFIGDVSSIINLADFSLAISTITNIPGENTVTISTTYLVFDSLMTTINSAVSVTSSLFASTFSAPVITTNILSVNSTIVASTISTTHIQFSTLSGTTINASNINFSTLQGQLVLTSSIESHVMQTSTLEASSILTSTINGQLGNFSTLNAHTLFASTVQVSTLLTSTIDGQIGNFSTLNVSTLQVSSISTQSIAGQGLRVSSISLWGSAGPIGLLSPFDGSLLIYINDVKYAIPIALVP
jgi:hypothetical protein